MLLPQQHVRQLRNVNVVDVLWWNNASAHCIPVGEDGMYRFATYTSYSNFQHVTCKIINEVTRTTTLPLTIKLQEHVEEAVVEIPSIKPRNLFIVAKRNFPQYSPIYWNKVKTPIYSYRRTLLKKMNGKSRHECGAQYERDSVLHRNRRILIFILFS